MNYNIQMFTESEFPDSVINFLNYLQNIKNASINTIEAYKKDLRVFLRFMVFYKDKDLQKQLEEKKIKFDDVDISKIDRYFLDTIKLRDLYAFMSFIEKHRKNGVYSRSRKVATLKSYFKYLYNKEKIINENPAEELESPKIQKRHPIYLTLDQSKFLLNSINRNNKFYERDYCILILFLNCGMRVSELCSIRLSRITDDTLTIVGKGDKERTIYLNKACLKAIHNYMEVRDDSKVKEEEKDFLFISSKNRPISVRAVEMMVKKHIKNAKYINEKCTPHKLRHTAATLIYKYGTKDILSLQDILGHESVATTQLYTHIDDDSLRQVIKSNPLSEF